MLIKNFQSAVISVDFKGRAEQISAPLLQGADDSQKLLLMNGVIELSARQLHRIEGHWASGFPGGAPREYSAGSLVRSIASDSNLVITRGDMVDDRQTVLRCDKGFNAIEDQLMSSSPWRPDFPCIIRCQRSKDVGVIS